MLNKVILRPGYHVRGGIYGANLSAVGGGVVEGPVVVRDEIILEPDVTGKKPMIFACGLNSRKSIQVSFSQPPPNSVVKDCRYNPLVIRGDICTDSLKLEGAVVLGTIYCKEGYIKDSIVFGNVRSETELHLENSTVLSFNAAARVVLHGANTLLMPYATVGSGLQFIEDRGGKAKLRYSGCCNCEDSGCASLCCEKYYVGECKVQEILITERDVYDGRSLGVSEKIGNRIVTVMPRVNNTKPILKQVNDLTYFLESLNLLSHFDKQTRNDFEQRHKNNFELNYFTKMFMYCTPHDPDQGNVFDKGEREKRWGELPKKKKDNKNLIRVISHQRSNAAKAVATAKRCASQPKG